MIAVVGGVRFKNLTAISVTSVLNSVSREFEISATSRSVGDIPFRKGQTVSILIGDEQVFNGFIEKFSIRAATDKIEYTMSGRDLLADLIDSNLTKLSDTGVTVEHACKTVLRFLGINVKVIDLASTSERPFEKANDIVAPEPSDTAAQFLISVARRRQALLTSDGDANLIITEGIGLRVDSRITHRRDGKGNNITEMEFETDDSSRFGVYTTVSQRNVAAASKAGGSAASAREIAGSSVSFRDPDIRVSRIRSIASESSYPLSDAANRARWEANVSRAEGLSYGVTIPSHTDGLGNIWKVNTAPIVLDEFAGIDTRMLVKAITYREDEEGETTKMKLTETGAFQATLSPREGFAIES